LFFSMNNLRICQAMSLNPQVSPAKSSPGSESVSSRVCIMGCQLENPKELRRFPVHDAHRCKLWLRHFGISEKRLDQLGGLQKLRICLRHFSQRQEMAKTRIKMTPLRKSTKGIILSNNAAGAVAGIGAAGGLGGGTAKTVVNSNTIKVEDKPQHLAKKPSIIVSTLPQRSHSISSSASSDVQSINSDSEASLPLDTQTGSNNRVENGQSKKRKLYLITEKSDESNGHILETNGQPKKRKMFVVVEQEKESSTGKKLMIVTDKPQADLTQHLEKLLPEILNRMQDKDKQKLIKPSPVVVNNPTLVTRPHITLPPKKNPTNFVKLEPSPVVPSSVPMPLPMPSSKPKAMGEEEEPLNPEEIETNINLSPDFRFLMKILPKLEQLPEPHKQNVKRSIQIFVEKSHSIYGKKD
ncbi:hypothetical protein KR038_006603, partial [Drosophila bunnanda]